MADLRPFCAEVSLESEEPLAATASHVEHWLLVEYRGLWPPDALPGSSLSAAVKSHLEEQLAELPRSRLLFIRRPERRRNPSLACYFAVTRERERRLHALELEAYEDLVPLDFTTMDGGSSHTARLFAVCTHGKRDRCCARYGQPLYDELRRRPEADPVWQSSHVGGDRFAGNVVAFPDGLYYGRVGRDDVRPLLDETLAGRIYLERFRGRACYPFPVQAADRLVRAETGLSAVDDVVLAGGERLDRGWRIRLHAGATGEVHEVDVEAGSGPETYLTCTSVRPQRPRRFVTVGHRILRE